MNIISISSFIIATVTVAIVTYFIVSRMKKSKDATEEYLKHNKITHLTATPSIKPVSVKVKTLRSISDTEEFAYLEEEHENKFY